MWNRRFVSLVTYPLLASLLLGSVSSLGGCTAAQSDGASADDTSALMAPSSSSFTYQVVALPDDLTLAEVFVDSPTGLPVGPDGNRGHAVVRFVPSDAGMTVDYSSNLPFEAESGAQSALANGLPSTLPSGVQAVLDEIATLTDLEGQWSTADAASRDADMQAQQIAAELVWIDQQIAELQAALAASSGSSADALIAPAMGVFVASDSPNASEEKKRQEEERLKELEKQKKNDEAREQKAKADKAEADAKKAELEKQIMEESAKLKGELEKLKTENELKEQRMKADELKHKEEFNKTWVGQMMQKYGAKAVVVTSGGIATALAFIAKFFFGK